MRVISTELALRPVQTDVLRRLSLGSFQANTQDGDKAWVWALQAAGDWQRARGTELGCLKGTVRWVSSIVRSSEAAK